MSTDVSSWFSSLRNAGYTTYSGPVPAPEPAVVSSDLTANRCPSVDGHSSDLDVDLLEVEVLDDDDDDDDDGDIGGDGQDTRRVRAAIGRCLSDIRENTAVAYPVVPGTTISSVCPVSKARFWSPVWAPPEASWLIPVAVFLRRGARMSTKVSLRGDQKFIELRIPYDTIFRFTWDNGISYRGSAIPSVIGKCMRSPFTSRSGGAGVTAAVMP